MVDGLGKQQLFYTPLGLDLLSPGIDWASFGIYFGLISLDTWTVDIVFGSICYCLLVLLVLSVGITVSS